jgi:hypothetical protein
MIEVSNGTNGTHREAENAKRGEYQRTICVILRDEHTSFGVRVGGDVIKE